MRKDPIFVLLRFAIAALVFVGLMKWLGITWADMELLFTNGIQAAGNFLNQLKGIAKG